MIRFYFILIFSSLIPFSFQSDSSSSSSSSSSFLSKFQNSLWNSKHTFQDGDVVDLLVNTATSSLIDQPYAYYKLPFICPNSNNAKPVHLSLSEIINGDRYWQSDYKLIFNKDEPCMRICDRIIHSKNIENTKKIIQNDYIANWVIDGIPASTTFVTDDGISSPKKYYIPGFSLGYEENGDYYLNNHLMMVIRFHKEFENPNRYSIVGVEIYPKSVSDYHCPGASKNYEKLKLDINAESQLLPFTYSIYWREDFDIDHSSRWKMYIDPNSIDSNGKIIDNYNNNNNLSKTIHWVSLINSFVILSVVSIIVAFIILSLFHSTENSNLNLIAQNSFIKPNFLILLSILSGSGIQLIFTLLGSGLLSFLFFRNNSFNQDTTILSLIIAVLIIGGFFAGFSSIQFFKIFNDNNSKIDNSNSKIDNNISIKNTILISSLSGSFLISLILIIIVITNSLIYDSDSPRSIKFSNFIFLFLLYTIFQIPISVIGGISSRNFNLLNKILKNYLSQSISSYNNQYQLPSTPPSPIKGNINNNKIVSTPIYLKLPFSLFIFGACPCSIVFIESKFLYSTLLSTNQSFSTSNYIYGFIISAAFLLLIIMIEIGIITCYLRLLKFNSKFNWQWWIFLTCSFSIWIYLILLSIYHLIFKMKIIDTGSPILYMVYSTIMNSIISIACGSLALWSATIFVYIVVFTSGRKKD